MISLCVPYYDDPERLHQFMLNECLDLFHEIIVVDDASQKFPARPIVEEYPRDNFSLYRIHEDYGFNAHGARNLAASVATGDWIFFIDIDNEPTPEFCQNLFEHVSRTPENNFVVCNIYGTDKGINFFCVRKTDFDKAGGYDEELRGHHIGDKLFRARLDTFCKPDLAGYILNCNRHGRKWIEDDSVKTAVYPDDFTIICPPMSRIQHALDMIEERNKHPEQWVEIPKLNFDFSLELV